MKIFALKKHILLFRILLSKGAVPIFVCLGILGHPPSVVGQPSQPFSQKMEKLAVQQEKVSKKLVLASQTRDYLRQRMESLKQEILGLQRLSRIPSYGKAVQFPRIRYNLSLLGRLDAYKTRLYEKTGKLKAVRAELIYLYQQLADDLKLVKTVSQIEMTKRLKRVDEVILNHSWVNQPYLFETKGLVFTQPKKIWTDFILPEITPNNEGP